MVIVHFVKTIWRLDHLFMNCYFFQEIWNTITNYCPIPIKSNFNSIDFIYYIWKHEKYITKYTIDIEKKSLLLLGSYEHTRYCCN